MDSRDLLARLYSTWCEDGKKPAEFEAFLSRAGYCVPRRTLNSWRALIRKKGSVVNKHKKVGRRPLLSAEQSRAVVGGCLARNSRGKVVTSLEVQSASRRLFKINPSKATALRLMKMGGLRLRVARPGKTASVEEMAKLCCSWLKEQHVSGCLRLHPP